jgi:hypothetical protein
MMIRAASVRSALPLCADVATFNALRHGGS